MTVTPVLRTAAGREIALPDIVLASEEVTSINLQQAVAEVAPELVNHMGSFGSAAVRFAGLNDRNVFAATMVYREGHPIDFHFDGYDAASNDGYFSGIEGIWWLPADTSTDFLIISNPSRKPVAGTLHLTSGSAYNNYNKQLTLTLGPFQTARIDIREAIGGLAGSDMGGLTLTFPNNEGISASQIVFDEVTGLAAIMKLFERDKDESVETHVLRAPMIALRQPDAALAYPKDTVLNPRLFLRNAGQNKLQVSAAIHWRSQDAEGTYNYPALNLQSNEVSVLDLGLLQDSRAIPPNANWSNVTLSYSGKSADLVPVAVSYDSKTRYGLQSPFTEGTNRMFKGGMWHVDSTHGTLITTGNGGSEKTAAQVTLFYGGGKSRYRIEKLLAPGQQLLLDVGQLIHNQIPDSDGNVIPPETMSGSYELRDLGHPAVGLLYEGKLTIDKTYGHASYGCGTCCGLYNPKLMPNPFSGPPSFDNQDSYLALEQCGGQWEDWTGTAYSWQSTNAAVATLPTSMLHTVAVGTATGSAQNLLQATHPAPRCPQTVMGGSQPVTVKSCGDVRDTIIGEYMTYNISYIPVCTDFTQTAHANYFTFAEINVTGDYSWALIRQPLIAAQTSGYGLDAWRANYGGPRIINSGYRNPKHNALVGGAAQSRHVFGDAADFRNQSFGGQNQNAEWQAMVNAANSAAADYVELSTGPCGYACTHADWRNHAGSYAP